MSSVHPHNYQPDKFHFFGRPRAGIYMGVELELDVKGYDGRVGTTTLGAAEDVEDLLGDFVYFKHDGSINGIEIVTHPASLTVQRNRWKKFFQDIPTQLDAGESCGLHVHLTKAPMGLLQQWAIHDFINNSRYAKFITALAGRNFNAYCHKIKKAPSEMGIYPHAKYEAVNTRGADTVELRLFTSTLKWKEFVTRLEFSAALTHLAMTLRGQKSITLDQFRKWVQEREKRYSDLAKYLEHI